MHELLGLTSHCEIVYRAMLVDPECDVSHLAGRLRMSEVDVGLAIRKLRGLGLLRPASDVPSGVRVVSPDVGFEVLLARQQAELAAHTQRIEQSRAAAAQLIAEYADLRPAPATPHIEHLVGLDAIRGRLAELSRTAKSEVMTFAPDGSHRPDAIEAARPLDMQLLERGVTIRTVYLDAIRNDPGTTDYLTWLIEQGATVRTIPSLPVRMIIIDHETVIIPVDPARADQGAIVLHASGTGSGSGTVTALCALFDTVWSQAAPLGQDRRRNPHALITQEREAMRLLAQGHTDATIARYLGVSPRTARRIAAELMSKLGARSRFQAGVLAVQDGLLPDIR